MTIKTCRNENEKYVIDAIIKTFKIDPDKISIKGWGGIIFCSSERIENMRFVVLQRIAKK